MATSETNQDAYKMGLMFEQHLNEIYDSVTCYKSELIPDPNDASKYYLKRWKRPDARSICNEDGGEFLTGELRKAVFNKHTAMGDLTQDEVADMTCNISCAIINSMMFYSQKYGVMDLSLLETVGLDLDMGIYGFLTSVRQGGMRKYGEKILTVTVVTRPAEQVQQTEGILK